MTELRFAAVVQEDGDIPRFARGLRLHEVWVKSTLLNMPRASGASSLADRLRRRLPQATSLGLYGWHYLTHRVDDPLPGRGTRTLPTGGAHGPCGHLQASEVCDAALDASVRAVEALGGRRLVLATPASFTPGSVGRARLNAFCERIASLGLNLAWEPTGLWDTAGALAAAAGRAEIITDASAWTSSAAGAPERPGAWLRVGGGGDRVHWSSGQADELAYQLGLHDSTPRHAPGLLFAGPRAFANLRTFQSVLDAG